MSIMKSKKRCRSVASRAKSVGTSNAARVSRGTEKDTWSGLTVKNPKRDDQPITVTVVLYNTVAGGVPSEEDVFAAIDDMEKLYVSCGWSGRLADAGAAFMKKELTVKDVMDIFKKVTSVPSGAVQDASVFPSDQVSLR